MARQLRQRGNAGGTRQGTAPLQQAQLAVEAAELGNIELLQANASELPALADESFDAVICSAALLYMPVQRALTEWHRLLRPGGTIGFSTMRAGFPPAGQLFRDCAAERGVQLTDPSAALGSEAAAAGALRQAGFTQIAVVAASVRLTDMDFACAWESNLRSAAHGEVRSLAAADLDALQLQFEHALDHRQLSGDRLTICLGVAGPSRPKSFATKKAAVMRSSDGAESQSCRANGRRSSS